jgi:uncharacterized membrane protein YkvA (DUF1232 family)
MAMKVTFDLTDNDLKYFRRVMKEVRAKHKNSSEQEILDACRALIEGISATRAPDFVRSRVEKLSVLIEMLEDTEWRIGGRDRERVVRGMAYFAEPDDMIPDKVPVLGFLDDAIMVELVVNELVHEIDAYADFCDFRIRREETYGKDDDDATREEWMESRRRALHDRIRRRRQRRVARSRGATRRSPISLW